MVEVMTFGQCGNAPGALPETRWQACHSTHMCMAAGKDCPTQYSAAHHGSVIVASESGGTHDRASFGQLSTALLIQRAL